MSDYDLNKKIRTRSRLSGIRWLIQIAVLTAIVVAIGIGGFYMNQYAEAGAMRIAALESELEMVQAEADRLQAEAEDVHSPKVVERLARELLGYVRRDEWIFRMHER